MAKVVLPRAEWGRSERLPPFCIYCGRAADGCLPKRLECKSGGFENPRGSASGEAVAAALALEAVKWLTVGNAPVRTTRLTVHLPVCGRHRRAWLIWSWFRMSLDHETLTLSGVADEFARAVTDWRTKSNGAPTPEQHRSSAPGDSK